MSAPFLGSDPDESDDSAHDDDKEGPHQLTQSHGRLRADATILLRAAEDVIEALTHEAPAKQRNGRRDFQGTSDFSRSLADADIVLDIIWKILWSHSEYNMLIPKKVLDLALLLPTPPHTHTRLLELHRMLGMSMGELLAMMPVLY